jgi:hypothetical protein
MNFTNAAQELSYTRVDDYLKTSVFKADLRRCVSNPHFDLRYKDNTIIEVDILPWENHPYPDLELAIVRASSGITLGSGPTLELMRFLLLETSKMRFGSFQIDDAGTVFFVNRILGGQNMDLVELETCILAVAAIANEYEDIITHKFGGQCARGLRLAEVTI